MTARLRGTAAAVTVALVCAVSVSSCSGSPASEIAYAVDGTLTTYNTNTVAGAASAGPQAFARVLTGFNYHGPDGQIVGDHDFGAISVVAVSLKKKDYMINHKAVYSDGKPVTCDDLVLAWASQSGRFPGFEAANQAGYREIATIDCAPGQKRARVTFAADRAFVDFGQLFAATSMMPSHVVSDELGIDVTSAIINNDAPSIDRIAKVWNSTWNLTPDLDLKRFPSSGPYKLESVTKDGGLVLVANDKWWGQNPSPTRSSSRRGARTSKTASTTAASTSSTSPPARRVC
jgi:peptide/nickel transport system substrate-binding protein